MTTEMKAQQLIDTQPMDAPDPDEVAAGRFRHDFVEDKNEDGKTIYYCTGSGKRILFAELKIKRMSEIDTKAETFRCRFHMYLTWLATKEDHELSKTLENSYKKYDNRDKANNYVPLWTPNLAWVNAVEIHPCEEHTIEYQCRPGERGLSEKGWSIDKSLVGFDPWDGIWNRVRYEYDITFAEEMELASFPFDCQDLTLTLKVEQARIADCDILPFPRPAKTSFVYLGSEFKISEWTFDNLICEFSQTGASKSKSRRVYAMFSIHIKASRRWQAHVGQMILTFCMFALGLCTFAQNLDSDDAIGNRLSYAITLLLADIATVQIAFNNVQTIGYWTIMDYYVYMCFVFLFCEIIWTSLAVSIDDLADKDELVFWIFFISGVISHIAFTIVALYYRKKEKTKLAMTSYELRRFNNQNLAEADEEQTALEVNFIKDDVLANKHGWDVISVGKRAGSPA